MRISFASILKHTVFTIISLLLVVSQTSFFAGIEIFGGRPQAVLLYCLALAFFEGPKTGAVYGVLCGYLLDVVSGGGVYFSAVIYMLVCYIFAYAVELYFNDGYLSYLAMSAVFVLIKQTLDVFVMLAKWADFNFGVTIVKVFLPELIYTLAVSALVYFPVVFLCTRFSREN